MRYNIIVVYLRSLFSIAERRVMRQKKSVKSCISETRIYTVEDIATILNISRNSAYNLVKEKQFHYVKIGSAIRISKKSFDEWLDRQSH